MVTGSTSYIVRPEDYYRNFRESIKAKDTFESYDQKLMAFMKYKGFFVMKDKDKKGNNFLTGDFASLIEGKDARQIEADIIDFIISLKEKHYSLASQRAYLSALIHFYSVNDVVVRRKKIAKFLSNDDSIIFSEAEGEGNNSGGEGQGEKPYTRQEIAKLLEFSDLREKTMILLMSSSGMRIGALPLLKIYY